MRVMLLTGLMSVAFAPAALATPWTPESIDCQVEEARRQTETRREQPPAQRATRANVAREDDSDTRPPPARRRNGKQIPDAELMAPRAVL